MPQATPGAKPRGRRTTVAEAQGLDTVPAATQRMAVEQRRAEAARLHLGGMTYPEIARRLAATPLNPFGYNPDDLDAAAQTVATDIHRLLKLTKHNSDRAADHYADVQHARLEALVAAYWPAAVTEQVVVKRMEYDDPEGGSSKRTYRVVRCAPDEVTEDDEVLRLAPDAESAGIVLRAIEGIRRIRGTDAPKRHEVAVEDGTTVKALEAFHRIVELTERAAANRRAVEQADTVEGEVAGP